jgi:hypothetical protein
MLPSGNTRVGISECTAIYLEGTREPITHRGDSEPLVSGSGDRVVPVSGLR